MPQHIASSNPLLPAAFRVGFTLHLIQLVFSCTNMSKPIIPRVFLLPFTSLAQIQYFLYSICFVIITTGIMRGREAEKFGREVGYNKKKKRERKSEDKKRNMAIFRHRRYWLFNFASCNQPAYRDGEIKTRKSRTAKWNRVSLTICALPREKSRTSACVRGVPCAAPRITLARGVFLFFKIPAPLRFLINIINYSGISTPRDRNSIAL